MKPHTILLVDDEVNIQNALERTLVELDNVTIFKASSGQEALEKLAKTDVHLIISDERMPGMSGVEFLKTAKEKYPEAMRIILTGYADIKAAISAINEGEIYRYLTKPWDDEELFITVRQALELYDLIRANQQLRKTVQFQIQYLQSLETQYPGISKVEKSLDGKILFDPDSIETDLEIES